MASADSAKDGKSETKKNTTLKLQFDKREFLRKPPAEAPAVSEDDMKTVIASLQASLTSGFLNFSSMWKGIAAQFRNTTLKHTDMSVEVVEAALTKVADNLSKYPDLGKVITVKYETAAGGPGATYGAGVRVFVLERKAN